MIELGLPVVRGTARHGSKTDLYLVMAMSLSWVEIEYAKSQISWRRSRFYFLNGGCTEGRLTLGSQLSESEANMIGNGFKHSVPHFARCFHPSA